MLKAIPIFLIRLIDFPNKKCCQINNKKYIITAKFGNSKSLHKRKEQTFFRTHFKLRKDDTMCPAKTI